MTTFLSHRITSPLIQQPSTVLCLFRQPRQLPTCLPNIKAGSRATALPPRPADLYVRVPRATTTAATTTTTPTPLPTQPLLSCATGRPRQTSRRRPCCARKTTAPRCRASPPRRTSRMPPDNKHKDNRAGDAVPLGRSPSLGPSGSPLEGHPRRGELLIHWLGLQLVGLHPQCSAQLFLRPWVN